MSNPLTNIVKSVIVNSSDQSRIKPTWVANGAYREIDPDAVAPLRVKLAALLHLTQLARQQLRGMIEDGEEDIEMQDTLIPGLQRRYPVRQAHNDKDPEYVNREEMTKEDADWNVERLRKESSAKRQHADRLQAWADDWFRAKRKAA